MKQLVDGQQDEAVHSLSGCGQYKLCEEYRYLQVDPQRWVKMTPEQRRIIVKQFDDASLHKSKYTSSELDKASRCASQVLPSGSESECGGASSVSSASCNTSMSVTSEDCGIVILPQATLKSMWTKAEEYLMSASDVVPAPGQDPKAKMVSSQSSNIPHFVRALSSGQYVCDNNCLQWKSSQICAHSIAVSETNGDLRSFLDWYIVTNQQPNFTSLAIHGLPAGRGRKGGIPKRQRSKTPHTDVTVLHPATCNRKELASGSVNTASRAPTSEPVTLNVSPSPLLATQLQVRAVSATEPGEPSTPFGVLFSTKPFVAGSNVLSSPNSLPQMLPTTVGSIPLTITQSITSSVLWILPYLITRDLFFILRFHQPTTAIHSLQGLSREISECAKDAGAPCV